MPSNSQRLIAILATGAIIATGGWTASKASSISSTKANETSATLRAISSQADADPLDPSETNVNQPMQISLNGIRSSQGTVFVALFDNEARYNSLDFSGAVRVQSEPAIAGTQHFTFGELPGGPYAIVVHHDENGNEEFDVSGDYPLEGYGTSRAVNAEQVLSFADASVPAKDIDIAVFYYGQ